MADEDKKERIETEGHLTSIITSDDAETRKDPLSLEISLIRNEIMTLRQGQSDAEKLGGLLRRFDSVLGENCDRIKRDYETQGCPAVEVEPAIGYFIPDVSRQNALLHGAEPSVIVTAKDLSEDGLDKFLLAAGAIGETYSQEAEILKFPIIDGRFDDYIKQKSGDETALIGTVTDDNIIPTFEVIVNIPELIGELKTRGLSKDHLENTEVYANIILQLANKQYGASTWPTRRQGFSTIYIKGWDGAGRSFEVWYSGLSDYLNRIPKTLRRSIEGGIRLGGEPSVTEQRPPLQGYRTVNELLIIPQKTPGILSGDNLLYTDLKNDKKRRELVKRLIDIL